MTPRTKIIIVAFVIIFDVFVTIPLFVSFRATHVRTVSDKTPAEYGLQYQNFTAVTEDGVTISGWFIPAAGNATVIVAHGYGGNKGTVLLAAKLLHDSGFNSVLFDFRGCGESGDSPTTFGVRESKDILAILAFVKSRTGLDPERIGGVGFSMGAATMIMTAGQTHDLKAIVADSPYYDFKETARFSFTHYTKLPSFLFEITYNLGRLWMGGTNPDSAAPYRYVDKISPNAVFLIQGKSDSIVPPDSADRLYSLANEPKYNWTSIDVEHTEAYERYPELYQRYVISFLRHYLVGDPALEMP
jgi:dipeptidyl aminopeptidase/acylaminoacyl peptidase